MKYRLQAVTMILDERDRQTQKWGDQTSVPRDRHFTVLGEEVGEVAEAILECKSDGEEWLAGTRHYIEECIQVAAVAACMAENALRKVADFLEFRGVAECTR